MSKSLLITFFTFLSFSSIAQNEQNDYLIAKSSKDLKVIKAFIQKYPNSLNYKQISDRYDILYTQEQYWEDFSNIIWEIGNSEYKIFFEVKNKIAEFTFELKYPNCYPTINFDVNANNKGDNAKIDKAYGIKTNYTPCNQWKFSSGSSVCDELTSESSLGIGKNTKNLKFKIPIVELSSGHLVNFYITIYGTDGYNNYTSFPSGGYNQTFEERHFVLNMNSASCDIFNGSVKEANIKDNNSAKKLSDDNFTFIKTISKVNEIVDVSKIHSSANTWEEWSIIRPLSQSQDIKFYTRMDNNNPNTIYVKSGFYTTDDRSDIKLTKTEYGTYSGQWLSNTGRNHVCVLSFANQDKINLSDNYTTWARMSDSDIAIRVKSPNHKQLVKENIPAESNLPTFGELVGGTLNAVGKVMNGGRSSSSSSDNESSSSSSNSSSNSKKCIFYVDTEKVHKGSIQFDYGYEFTIFDNEGDNVQAYFDYRKSGEHLSNNNDPWYADGYWVETKDLAIKKIMKSKGCPNFEIKKGKLDD